MRPLPHRPGPALAESIICRVRSSLHGPLTPDRSRPVWPFATVLDMSHYNPFKRGDRVCTCWGRNGDLTGVVDSAVFQKTVDYPDVYAAGFHVVLDDERVITVRWGQLASHR